MAPRPKEKQLLSDLPTGPLNEADDIVTEKVPQDFFVPDDRPLQIVWKTVVIFSALHLVALYGLFLAITTAKWGSIFYIMILYLSSMFGVTGGAHRLWAHRAYKAKWPLKLILVISQTLAHQNSVIEWSKDHRLHHKFQETDGDPHNAKRGFFFSHVGWLLCRKHEQVKLKLKNVDVSDLYAEPLLRFQHKYFLILMPIVAFVLPTIIPMLLWGETYTNAACLNILRYICCLHATWFVNSAAHMFGSKPYDKYIDATEIPILSFFALGEGWHNYHHTFPWDYKAAEFGNINWSLKIMNFFAKVGWAYDLKTVSKEMIQKRVLRTGDGSHEIWGWGDKDQTKEDYDAAIIHYPKSD